MDAYGLSSEKMILSTFMAKFLFCDFKFSAQILVRTFNIYFLFVFCLGGHLTDVI